MLLQNHGVFTIGNDGARGGEGGGDVRGRRPQRAHRPAARRAAADRSRPTSTPCYDRYQNEYGQRRAGPTEQDDQTSDSLDRPPDRTGEIWFLTGSQDLYGAETLRQVEAQSRGVAERLGCAPGRSTSALVWKPVLTESAAIRRACLDANGDDRCIGVIAWMHTFSPAKMWIHGLDELRKPLLHLHTQANEALPWSTIDMDFMNLNQAAHGDREFAHVQTRLGVARKTVAGHVGDPEVGGRVGTWVRAARRRRMRCAPCAWPASATTCATSPSPRATRSRPSTASACRSTPTASTTSSRPSTQSTTARSTRSSTTYLDRYDVAAELRPGGERADVAARTRPASRPACASSSTTAASARSRPTSRTSAACASSPAWPCSD